LVHCICAKVILGMGTRPLCATGQTKKDAIVIVAAALLHHYLAALASAFFLAAQRARTAAPIRFLASADILCPLRVLVFVLGLGEV
jgi:hypothetical protein